MGNSKSSILQKIRAALKTSTRLPFPETKETPFPFQPLQQDIVVEFAEQFTQLQGRFDFCTDEKFSVLVHEGLLYNDIASCDVAVTGCEALVARTGSIMLSSQNSGRVT